MRIQDFGHEVLALLRAHLSPATVTFRGSFASGAVDAYSDVDLLAEVHQELNQAFFESLVKCLENHFGPLSLRYDPDHKENAQAQDVRINFYDLSVFWRIDLNITSDRPCSRKWPDPFPKWSVARSAFWNVVWAVKHARRGRPVEVPDHYMGCACDKLHRPRLPYAEADVLALLDELFEIEETDKTLIAQLRQELCQPPDRGDAQHRAPHP